MVMVIIGILAAVSIPRFAGIVRQSEVASEQGVLISMVAALDTWSHERYIEEGILKWPSNPFNALNKVPPAYDKTGETAMIEMNDSDWIFTGTDDQQYPNRIVHRRKQDSLAIWTYDPLTGELGYSDPPYVPAEMLYRSDLGE
jgi:type II secretory pathway pseudopilin PulG